MTKINDIPLGSSKKFKEFYNQIKDKAKLLKKQADGTQQISFFQGEGEQDQSVSIVNMDNNKYAVVKGEEEGDIYTHINICKIL